MRDLREGENKRREETAVAGGEQKILESFRNFRIKGGLPIGGTTVQ